MSLRQRLAWLWWNRQAVRNDLAFVWRNLVRSLRLPPFPATGEAQFQLRGATATDIARLAHLYRTLLHEENLAPRFARLLRLRGSRLCLVAEAPDGEIAGFVLFYFDVRDIEAGTIHEGFIGVAPPHRGRGLSSVMRHAAIRHFAGAGLNGISTRISTSNQASIAPALRMGFQIVERYFDPQWSEERAYLTLWFGSK